MNIKKKTQKKKHDFGDLSPGDVFKTERLPERFLMKIKNGNKAVGPFNAVDLEDGRLHEFWKVDPITPVAGTFFEED